MCADVLSGFDDDVAAPILTSWCYSVNIMYMALKLTYLLDHKADAELLI